MDFEIGQKIICVDASLPANPWHREHPLKWGGIYVREINKHDPAYIRIDSSMRIREQKRFRPLDRKTKTGIAFAHEILKGAIRAPEVVSSAGQDAPST